VFTNAPGWRFFGYNFKKGLVVPAHRIQRLKKNRNVSFVDNNGKKLGEGIVEKILRKPNKTNIARVKALDIHGEDLVNVRGFIVKRDYPEPLEFKPYSYESTEPTYVCHCDDVTLDEIMEVIVTEGSFRLMK